MLSIGWYNLKKDPSRMAVAVFGVVFSVVLITVEVGMLLGLVQNASLLIDHSNADIWVSTVNVQTFDFATPISQRKKYLLESIPGVDRVEEYNSSYSIWKLPSGGNANCQVVGFDPHGKLAAPLTLAAGNLEDLHNQDSIIIDEAERSKLENPNLGDHVEVFGRRAQIVGFTRGMRSFTTTPYVFTSLERGQQYGWLREDEKMIGSPQSIYFLVKVNPGADVESICKAIVANVPDVDAHTREGFSWRTRSYWLLETGMGIGFLVAAFLGLAVGAVIVSQTLYTMTVEKLPEFGVLKAMGASMHELSRVVLTQGLLCGLVGLVLGLGVSYLISGLATSAGTAVLIPWPLAACVGIVTGLLCAGAALASITRLRRLEPAAVFRT